MSQAEALRATVAALELRPEHQALVAYCEGLAEIIDEYPERATLWREYRPAVELLLTVGEADVDDGQAALLELVRTPMRAEVRDAAESGAGDVGAGGGGNRRKSRPAVDAVAASGSGRRTRASS